MGGRRGWFLVRVEGGARVFRGEGGVGEWAWPGRKPAGEGGPNVLFRCPPRKALHHLDGAPGQENKTLAGIFMTRRRRRP